MSVSSDMMVPAKLPNAAPAVSKLFLKAETLPLFWGNKSRIAVKAGEKISAILN